jgi:hypothetical protein
MLNFFKIRCTKATLDLLTTTACTVALKDRGRN